MASAKEYRLKAPVSAREVQRVVDAARRAFPSLKEPFPQDVKVLGRNPNGWVPSLEGGEGVRARKWVQVRSELDAERVSTRVVADIMGGARKVVGRGDYFGLMCPIRLPDRPGREARHNGWLWLYLTHGDMWFGFNIGDFGVPWNVTGRKKARYYAEEREYEERVMGEVIRAADLPLKIVPSGKSFAVQHTGGGELKNTFESKEFGLGSFDCNIPRATAADFARRLERAVAAVKSVDPPEYELEVTAPSEAYPPDTSHDMYEFLQRQDWPVRSTHLYCNLQVDSALALDGLRPFLIGGKKHFRLLIGRMKSAAPPARTAKLFVSTQPDGHDLVLQLPPEHEAWLPDVEKALGVSFQK